MNPVEQFLQANQITFIRHDHLALHTTEDAEKLGINIPGFDCKNLFLIDKKTQRYFLVILPGHKQADLKQFAKLVDAKRLSFANAEALFQKLNLTPGSVSPFGLINDPNHNVKLFINQEILDAPILNFHPNINTASLEITNTMFKQYLKIVGHHVNII